MAEDINPARRTELLAAIAVLEPQIRGLHDLMATSISPDLQAAVQHQITVRERRNSLLHAEITAMDMVNADHDALLADGYPALNDAILDSNLMAELTGEESDLDAAVGVFAPTPQATSLSMSFGSPEPKPAA